MTLVLLALVAAAATAWVLQPLFRPEAPAPGLRVDPTVLRLQERREQLVLALAELDFERDAGKLAEDEHRELRGRLLLEAAEVTRALDDRGGSAPEGGGPPGSREGEAA